MTIHSSIKGMILAAQKKASEVVDAPPEMLRGFDEQMERKSNGALCYIDRIWVPLMGDVRTLIKDKAHKSSRRRCHHHSHLLHPPTTLHPPCTTTTETPPRVRVVLLAATGGVRLGGSLHQGLRCVCLVSMVNSRQRVCLGLAPAEGAFGFEYDRQRPPSLSSPQSPPISTHHSTPTMHHHHRNTTKGACGFINSNRRCSFGWQPPPR
nr:putative reverse transcriptase domain-containing protein [Tanacetum cinerariifolium]